MGITDINILFYHGISEQSRYKNVSMIEYNERTVYSCFGKYFSADYGSPELNPPPIPIDSDYRPKTLS